MHSPTVIQYVEYCKIRLLAKNIYSKKNKGEYVMRDGVGNEEIVKKIVKERINSNIKMFNLKEQDMIENNFNTIVKIYLLGLIDKI